MTDELGKALIGSSIPLLIATLFAWLGNKNYHAKRSSLIDHARQRIEPINAYGAPRQLATGDLAELSWSQGLQG